MCNCYYIKNKSDGPVLIKLVHKMSRKRHYYRPGLSSSPNSLVPDRFKTVHCSFFFFFVFCFFFLFSCQRCFMLTLQKRQKIEKKMSKRKMSHIYKYRYLGNVTITKPSQGTMRVRGRCGTNITKAYETADIRTATNKPP